MTKEKRMEPPRLSLVPSSRESHDHAAEETGEETPRVTIRSLQSFDNLSKRTRLQLEVEVDEPSALSILADALAEARDGNGQVRLKARLEGGAADVILGRDFAVDAELAARIERLPGIRAVQLSLAEPPRLALVS